MAWNKPSETKVEVKGGGGQSKVYLKGILVGAVAVVVGVVCIFAFSGKNEKPVKDTGTKSAKIKEVTPAVARTNVVEEKKEVPYWLVDESQTNGFTREMLHKWRDRHAPEPRRFKRVQKRSKWHIFEHRSENMIASLLRAKPGQGFIGTIRLDGYTEDFLKSCQVPIIVSPDDDEYTKALKQEMKETKIALKERIDAGEGLEDIIENTRDEFRKLAQFKKSLMKEVRELLKTEARTSEDIDTFEASANKMLAEKGIAPIKFSAITRERLLNMKGDDDL